MSPRNTLLLFGDQTAEFATSIRRVVAASKSSSRVVRKFLRDALDVVQIEIRKLPSQEADKPHDDAAFSLLLEEPEAFDQMEDRMGLMQTTMTSIARLGELILHAERDPTLLSPDRRLHAVGLCTGLLSAVTLAAAVDLEDLLNVAVAVVGVAFRLRLELHYRSRRVEASPGIWGYLVIGVRADEAVAELERFHAAESIPAHKQAYIAVAADTWITIFGAPSVMLRLLRDSPFFSRASSAELYRATGAVHASHLPGIDFAKVIGDSDLFARDVTQNVQVYSTSSCAPFDARPVRKLLEEVLHDIFNRRLELTGTMDAAASAIPRASQADVISVGGSSAIASLQQALERRGTQLSIIEDIKLQPERGIRGGSGKIAVVGVGGRFPGPDPSVAAFWQSLLEGREFHKKVPSSRWKLDAWQHALGPDAELPYGCWLENPGEFDARLFNISPREAAQMDPIQRLLMLVTYEALDVAGYAPEATPAQDRRRISAFFGMSSDDWRDINHQHGIDAQYVPSIARAFGAGRLHHYFKWEGPATTVDSACGSSAVAIATACNALRSRECDMALAGGGMLACSPDAFAGLAKGGFLSPTGSCKTYRNDVDGYCRGEAVAMVVLKRLEDAEMDNDNILGVIDGYARNHSAYASSITHPHQPSQERVFREALHAAGTQPVDIGYVEAHGTGTTAGDMCEVSAIDSVLGTSRPADKPLLLGAVKANVGHGESAAAIVALVKVLMVLKHGGKVPPQPGFKSNAQLNPDFPPLEQHNVHVAHGSHSQLGTGQKVLMNCFDATGGNTCFVVSRPQPKERRTIRSNARSHHLVVCSGHTFTAMKKNERLLLDYVMGHRTEHPGHLAYTSTARRLKHYSHRTAFVVKDLQELGSKLLKTQGNTNSTIRKTKSVAFTFTGQGACHRAMGRELFHTSPRFRATVRECQAVCDMHGFASIEDFFAGRDDVELPADQAAQEQLALVTLQVGLVDLLRSWGVQPDVVVGHSLGEYASLYTAGVLSLSDTLYLVGERTKLLKKLCTPHQYSMLVIPLPAADVERLVSNADCPGTHVSCKNTDQSTVCSGPTEEVDRLKQHILDERQIDAPLLAVPYGFHSAQMVDVAKLLEDTAHGVHFNEPTTLFASTLHGRVVLERGAFTPRYVAQQTRQAVEFRAAVLDCRERGIVDDSTLWVELGPDAVCTRMVRGCGITKDPERLLATQRACDACWHTLHQTLAGLYLHGREVDWKAFHDDSDFPARLVDTAPYAFDSSAYWRSYACDAPRVPEAAHAEASACVPPPCLTPFVHQRTGPPRVQEGVLTARFASRVHHPEMVAAARGHLVDGTPIFPGSAFCEMGYAAAEHVLPLLTRGGAAATSTSGLVLTRLDMHRPLVIATDDDPATVYTEARARVRRGAGGGADAGANADADANANADRNADADANANADADVVVEVAFSLKTGPDADAIALGLVQIETSRCPAITAKTGPTSSFLVQARCTALIAAVREGAGHVLRTSVIYRLFSRYIGYGPAFQGLHECFLSDDQTEAAAVVKLVRGPATSGDAAANNCYWRDTLFHLAGYMLNGHPDGRPDDAYIAVAVDGIVFDEELSADETYTVYTYMKPTETGAIGDVYVFRKQRLVALCADMVYKRVSLANRGRGTAAAARSVRPREPQPVARLPASTTASALRGRPVLPQEQVIAQINPRGSAGSMQNQPSKPIREKRTQPPLTGGAGARNNEPDAVELILQAVADETGWDKDSFDDNTALADLGVDSLMTIVISSKLRSTKGVELASNTFRNCVTVADVRAQFGKPGKVVEADEPQSLTFPNSDPTPRCAEEAVDIPVVVEPATESHTSASSPASEPWSLMPTPRSETPLNVHPHTTDVQAIDAAITKGIENDPTLDSDHRTEVFLIQGLPDQERPPLFLVPDGSGSITSFLALPQFPSGICIYGLHSPWVSDPEAFTCSIEQASRLYLEAVRERQPHGPYIFGGWSAGCVFAYELARQLLEAGEEVLGLIVIDMHRPKPLPEWIDTTKELWEFWCESTGLKDVFAPLPSGQGLEEHLIKNFRALNKYDPVPMKPGKRPKHGTLILWATKGMGDVKKEDFPDIADPLQIGEWFCFDRTDFGPRGWDELVGDQIECVALEGNHRSIMVPPDADQLVEVLERGLAKFLA